MEPGSLQDDNDSLLSYIRTEEKQYQQFCRYAHMMIRNFQSHLTVNNRALLELWIANIKKKVAHGLADMLTRSFLGVHFISKSSY